ncbi:MAG: hypothetical protein R2741_04960 [Methanolobus sp.]
MLPYDNVVIEAMVAGKSVVEYSEGKFSEGIRSIWDELVDLLLQKEKEGLIKMVQ